jgi:pyridoxamine 5'-phosphate oxidase
MPSDMSPSSMDAESLDPESLDPGPMAQFARWLADAEAAGLPEPNAMVLATVSPETLPHARSVLLKGHNATGFIFYTNRTSRKGLDLAAHPHACVVFPWYGLGRQVTAEGEVVQLSQAESEPYFHSRPHGSQLGAWASRQSTVIASRAELDERYEELARRWPEGTPVPMPDFWGGYLIRPHRVEFWQSRRSRLHDRLQYRWDGAEWKIERLSP